MVKVIILVVSHQLSVFSVRLEDWKDGWVSSILPSSIPVSC